MDDAARMKLWSEYGKTHSPQIREKIIVEYAPLVKVVAGRMAVTKIMVRKIRATKVPAIR